MKKFRFSLETVLEYKQQILDSLQAEHGAILARIRQQEEHIEMLEAEYRHLSQEFNRRKTEGISILDALKYAPADKVRLELNTGISPCILTPVEGEENFLYMVLPVRLKNS